MSRLDANELKDVFDLSDLIDERNMHKEAASNDTSSVPHVNLLAKLIHPKEQRMAITDVKDENPLMRTFRMEAADGHELAYFRAGQYVPIFLDIDGNTVERPYALSSSPEDSLKGYYEISVKRAMDGYVSNYICNNWKTGTEVVLGSPTGFEYYSPLRDARHIIGIAGGIGVTPFRSMARAIADGTLDAELTLFYGCNSMDDVAFANEWTQYETESNGKFKYVLVLANETVENIAHGFITVELIKQYHDIHNASIFISGPKGLIDHAHAMLDPLGLRPKLVRYGLNGEAHRPAADATNGTEYSVTVHQAGNTVKIPANSNETILVALERAGLKPPVRCRSGECGFCRAYLIDGDIDVISEEENKLRKRDKELGYIHPCCSFPASNLEVLIHRN